MRKNKSYYFLFAGMLALTGALSSCGEKPQPEPDPKHVCADINKDHLCDECGKTLTSCLDEDGDNHCDICGKLLVEPKPSDYYNEKNFIKGERTVTETKLVTYDGPSLFKTSEKVGVKVEGKDLFVYETRVNHGTKFSWDVPNTTAPYVLFDFEGKVHVEITVLEDVAVEKAVVRPLVYGIVPTIKDKTISFDLEYNGNYTLEYNDNAETAVHIFANPLETDVMRKEDADGVHKIYVGPGVYNAGTLPLSSDCEIYLAGGAYVYGQVSGESFDNIKIYGRGIISGSIFQRRSESEYTLPIKLRFANNVTINDIAIMDPAGWAITIEDCTNVRINNIKIITARQNGDGISVQGCHDVEVRGGFVRTWDDSLVVKNVNRKSTDKVLFDGVTVWTDLAQSMEVGYETYGPTMNDITFQNITVLHNFHKALISMHNCDDAVITNVTYKNITLEDGQMLGDDRKDGENDFLFDFTIAYNIDWTKSAGERGSINGVTIENVKVYNLLDSIGGRFLGESQNSSIKNVSIKGIEIKGVMKSSLEDLKATANTYTSNITVTKLDEVLGAYIKLPYVCEAKGEAKVSEVKGIEQEGMLVPEFSYQKGGLPYIGVKSSVVTTNKATHSAGSKTTTPVDDEKFADYTAEGSSVLNATDGDTSTYWRSGLWTGEDKEFAGLTMNFDNPITVGKLRIYGEQENPYYYTYSIEIWVRKQKTDGTMNPNFIRLSASKDYEMTPAKGNAIDININAALYGGIQLRLFRVDSASAAKDYRISEVEFFSPSLSFGKAIVDSTEHNDVYNVEKVVDGEPNGTSYYESKTLPAYIVIDLGNVYNISTVVFHLPAKLDWTTRTQNIAILGCSDNLAYSKSMVFTEILAATNCTFDPMLGNMVKFDFNPTVSCRHFKVVINSNDIKAGYGAQLSEIDVFGN